MPQGIHSFITETEEKLIAERAIAERFPDAVIGELGDGGDWVWWSEKAASEVTDFDLVAIPRKDGLRTDIRVYGYLCVEKMRVYARNHMSPSSISWLYDVKRNHPEVYQSMVATVRW